MPKKSSKKRKEKKQDFQKAKLKVGKTAALPANRTDTTITSKRVYVPTQSLSTETDIDISVVLKDHVNQLSHYSAQNRKESIKGLISLYAKSPQLMHTQLGYLLQKLPKLMLDDDGEVRKLLVSLLDTMFGNITENDFQPFLVLLMAFTSSSMTHIMEYVRLDGVKFLQILVKNFPTSVCSYSSKIIPNYISLLTQPASAKNINRGMTSSSSIHANPNSKLGSSKSRFDILNGFHDFLVEYLNIGSDRFWFFNTNKNRPKIVQKLSCFESATAPQTSYTKKEIVSKMMPILIDFWLESLPSVLTISKIRQCAHLNVMHITLKTMNLLWRSFEEEEKESEWYEKWLDLICKHFLGHFPFGGGLDMETKVEYVIQDMNIIFTELLSRFILNPVENSLTRNDNPVWFRSMINYILKFYGCKDLKTMDDDVDENLFQPSSINITHLESTYPIIWTLLSYTNEHDRLLILEALLAFHTSHRATSNTFSSLFYFIEQITIKSKFIYENERRTLKEWIVALPKYVYRIEDETLISDMLSFLNKCVLVNLFDISKDSSKIINSITPLFEFPKYLKPSLTLLHNIPLPWSTELTNGVLNACKDDSVSNPLRIKILDVLFVRQNAHGVDPVYSELALSMDLFVKFLVGFMNYSSEIIDAMCDYFNAMEPFMRNHIKTKLLNHQQSLAAFPACQIPL